MTFTVQTQDGQTIIKYLTVCPSRGLSPSLTILSMVKIGIMDVCIENFCIQNSFACC